MGITGNRPPKNRSFHHMVILFVFLIISITIGFLSTLSFLEARDEIADAYQDVMNHTDEIIRQATALVTSGWSVKDAGTDVMLASILTEYTATSGPPGASETDQEALRESIQRLYGEHAEIVLTVTHNENPPYFGEDAGSSRPGEQPPPQPDGQIVHSAYILSADGTDLIQAEVTIPHQENIPPLYLYDAVQKAQEINPGLESVRLYDAAGNQIINPGEPINTTPETLSQDIMHQILTERSDMEVTDAGSYIVTRYLYLEPDSDADPAAGIRIVEITYNLQKKVDEINSVLFFNFTTGMLGIVFGALIAITFSWYITRPVDAIVEDVAIIARGNLDHTIRATNGMEFARLEESINLMVGRLKETIERLKASEETVKEYSEHLEEKVAYRTGQLQIANEEANLYIDILLHDINNANTVTLAYLELLKESLSGEEKTFAENALIGARKSADIIKNVGTIQKTYEKKTALKPVKLDSVIRKEISRQPDVKVHYGGTDAVVCADDLLGEIFTNLIGNSRSHAGQGAEVFITVTDGGSEVKVSVEDTGPGIPDDLKPAVFERFTRGSGGAPGTVLGLYICRSLANWYGGTIQAGDRVEGQPEKGASIRFTLHKYPQDRPATH